jgi:hypothetical protein
MTAEEIAAERYRDYATLGRFIGLAGVAKDGGMSLERIVARLIEILDEYRPAEEQPISSEVK